MNIGKLFCEYWNVRGRYKSEARNLERFRMSLQDKMNGFTRLEEIDWYVSSLRTRKESTRLIMVDFFDYLREKKNIEFESGLNDRRYYDYPFERQLEIAKYLHEKHTPGEIRNKFDIDERTIRADLAALENGITVLGAEIRITRSRRGNEMYYKSTMHPVFLPLNLTEVYALTTYLDRIEDDDPNAPAVRSIANRIRGQLSDYAVNIISGGDEALKEENKYMNEEEMVRNGDHTLSYLIKSQTPFEFMHNGKIYFGKVQHRGGTTIILEDGSVLDADIRDIKVDPSKLRYR